MKREYPKGQIIFFPGDKTDSLYKLNFGAVKVYSIDDSGAEHILVIRSAPDTFPMSLLIGKNQVDFFYEALTVCGIELVPKETIALDEIARQAIELYYEGLHRIASLLSKTASSRATEALDYAKEHGIKQPTQQMVAEMSNLTRETVSKEIDRRKK